MYVYLKPVPHIPLEYPRRTLQGREVERPLMQEKLNTADNGGNSTSQIPLFFSFSLDVTFDRWKNRNCIVNTFLAEEEWDCQCHSKTMMHLISPLLTRKLLLVHFEQTKADRDNTYTTPWVSVFLRIVYRL